MATKDKANIIISTYGNGIAVGLQGTKEQIEREFNRFFNWGATGVGQVGGYLHELSDSFAYFLSTETDMLRAMAYECMTRWQDSPISSQYKSAPLKRGEKKSKGTTFRQHARNAAIDEFNSYPRENFMLFEKSPNDIYNELDGGAPDWTSETED